MAFFCKSFAVELLICAIPSFRFGGRVVTEWQSEHIRWTKFQSSSLCSHLAVCPPRTKPEALICANAPELTSNTICENGLFKQILVVSNFKKNYHNIS